MTQAWKQRHYDREALFKRLFKNRIIDPETDCWIAKSVKESGYGIIRFQHNGHGSSMRIHRLVAWLYFGYDGSHSVEVCHRCNVKACFNPAHLYLATHATNMADAVRDKLLRNHARGEKMWRAKLTEDKVREIRILNAGGGRTLRSLGKQFGVDACTIGDIVHGRTWRHVSEVLQ